MCRRLAADRVLSVARLHKSVDTTPQSTILKIAEAASSIAATILVVCTFWLWHMSASSRVDDSSTQPDDKTLEQNIRYMQTGKIDYRNLGRRMIDSLAMNGQHD